MGFAIVALNALEADEIGLADTLAMIEEHFAAVAAAVCNGEFALWIGSGISRGKAPDVGRLISTAIEHLRAVRDPLNPNDPLAATLKKILIEYAGLDAGALAALMLDQPFNTWPEHDAIVNALWSKYSTLLNIRPTGKERDYLLWEAVDVRAQYGHLAEPDTEHLCIAILILEGVVELMASGNWDGLIEAAVDQLSVAGKAGLIQAIVDPEDVRDPPAAAVLVKFHGCAVACVLDQKFRRFLVGSERDIVHWPNVDDPMHREVERIATNKRGLFVGLSLQDANLKNVFSKARAIQPWPWPPPKAQAQVFCEDQLGHSQELVLEVVYGDAAYDKFTDDIKAASLLRARPKTVLPALVLHVLGDKLQALAERGASALGPPTRLALGIGHLRDKIAAAAPDAHDLEAFVTEAIRLWSRALALFREGQAPPPDARNYLSLSSSRKAEMILDPNVTASGLDEFAVALGLVGLLASGGIATISASSGVAAMGALKVKGTYDGAKERKVTFAATADSALQLLADGAFDDEDAIILHSGEAFARFAKHGARSPSGMTPLAGAKHVSVRRLILESATVVDLEEQFLKRIGL